MIGLRVLGKDAVMASVMTDFREIPNIPCRSPRFLVEIRLLWVLTVPEEPPLGVIPPCPGFLPPTTYPNTQVLSEHRQPCKFWPLVCPINKGKP